MIGKEVRINCYTTTYVVKVTHISEFGIHGPYSGVHLDQKSRKYKKDWEQSNTGTFIWEEMESLKVLK